MHSAMLAVVLGVSTASLQASSQCSAPPIPESELREIAMAQRNKVARKISKASWEFEISREGCSYRVFAREVPPRVASHFSVLIDENKRVLRYFGGM